MSIQSVKDNTVHRQAIAKALETRLSTLKLDQDPSVAAVQVAQAAQAEVDSYLKTKGLTGTVPPEMRRIFVHEALGASTKALKGQEGAAALAQAVGAATTTVRLGKAAVGAMEKTLGSFNPAAAMWSGAKQASTQELANDVAALAAHAAVANEGHTYHFGLAASDTAGPTLDPSMSSIEHAVTDTSGLARQAEGGPNVRSRATHLPLDMLRDLAATGDAAARALLVRAHAETAVGVYAGLSMLATTKQPSAGAEFVAQMKQHQDPLANTDQHTTLFRFSKDTDFTIETAGAQLSKIWFAFEKAEYTDVDARNAGLAQALKDNPLGRQFLVAAQLGFVKSQLEGEDRYKGNYKHADELSPDVLIRNMPIAVSMIEGLRAADRSAAMTFGGDVSTQANLSQTGFDRQLLLESAAAVAMAQKTAAGRQGFFASAVANEAAQSLGVALHRNDPREARYTAGAAYDVLRQIAVASAEEYTREGGGGASASTLVGMKFAGQLLAAVNDTSKTPEEWQAHALDIASRISLQDVAAMASTFFGRAPLPPELQDGQALRAKLTAENKGDDWFVGHVAGVAYEGGKPKLDAAGHTTAERLHPTREELIAAGKKPLSEAELRDALVLMFAANTGWKQQTERKDATRVDSTLRAGVLDNYENLGAGKGNDSAALYVLLKDAWEVLTKGEKLAQQSAQ